MSAKNLECDVCGYKCKDETIVRVCQDRVVRCKVCRDKAKHGRYISEKEMLTLTSPPVLREWENYIEDVTE